MTLASEITNLETELQSSRVEAEALGKRNAVLEFENDSLKQQLAKANAEREVERREEASGEIESGMAAIVARRNGGAIHTDGPQTDH
ncbi:hypothetical protein [Bradyrhizobium liaoningense]|uniref:hypothetical protein n=1 Tax=Bradyrhizobium liaoningense TaxID=43992 RepID=UPI001BA87FF2|nr:hypothetical protein [Bradyrhizobium liaoningense]MBR1033023.1 hypothetical protein [Bradyrhizobium liaoningense]